MQPPHLSGPTLTMPSATLFQARPLRRDMWHGLSRAEGSSLAGVEAHGERTVTRRPLVDEREERCACSAP